MGVPLGTGLSVNYFVEIRPGYEGVYDLVTDRFGNHTTGFSGIGVSPFAEHWADRRLGGCSRPSATTPSEFKGVVARNL